MAPTVSLESQSMPIMKAMMVAGRDPREGIFPSLGLTVCSLLAVAHRIAFHAYYPQPEGLWRRKRLYYYV